MKMHTSITALILLFTIGVGCSSATETQPTQTNNHTHTNNTSPSQKTKVDYTTYDRLLNTYVDENGQVDYLELKNTDSKALQLVVSEIGTADLDSLNTQEKLAFYLNAYNAIVLNKVVNLLPISSIESIDGFFDKQKHTLAGKMLTLNDLENTIIRPTFKEPLIHFALVCAAKSCPPLKKKSYRADTLNAILKTNAEDFIKKNTSVVGKTVITSQIFNWYGEDFVAAKGSVGKYLAIFLPEQKETLESNDLVVEFSDYDWALNIQSQ